MKYKYTYYDAISIFPRGFKVLTDTKTTWKSETLDDRYAIEKYFDTLKRAYEANNTFITLNVHRENEVILGVRIDDPKSPYFGGSYNKFLEIEEVDA